MARIAKGEKKQHVNMSMPISLYEELATRVKKYGGETVTGYCLKVIAAHVRSGEPLVLG